MNSIGDVLGKWMDEEITVINPQSYSETVIREVVHMETYQAKVAEIGGDFVRLTFTAMRKKEEQPVDQVIPIHEIKRISQWGGDRFLHL